MLILTLARSKNCYLKYYFLMKLITYYLQLSVNTTSILHRIKDFVSTIKGQGSTLVVFL